MVGRSKVVFYCILVVLTMVLAVVLWNIPERGSISLANDSKASHQPVTVPVHYQSEYKLYEDKELGISFSYPRGYIITNTYKVNEMYNGDIYTIRIQDNHYGDILNITAATSDFVSYIAEGSPMIYAAPPLDTSQRIDWIRKKLEEKLFMVSHPHTLEMDGVMGVEGYGVHHGYGISVNKILIFPLQHEKYTNVTIHTDPFLSLTPSFDPERKEELRRWIESIDMAIFESATRNRIMESIQW